MLKRCHTSWLLTCKKVFRNCCLFVCHLWTQKVKDFSSLTAFSANKCRFPGRRLSVVHFTGFLHRELLLRDLSNYLVYPTPCRNLLAHSSTEVGPNGRVCARSDCWIEKSVFHNPDRHTPKGEVWGARTWNASSGYLNFGISCCSLILDMGTSADPNGWVCAWLDCRTAWSFFRSRARHTASDVVWGEQTLHASRDHLDRGIFCHILAANTDINAGPNGSVCAEYTPECTRQRVATVKPTNHVFRDISGPGPRVFDASVAFCSV